MKNKKMEHITSSAQTEIYKDGTEAIKSGLAVLHNAYFYCS